MAQTGGQTQKLPSAQRRAVRKARKAKPAPPRDAIYQRPKPTRPIGPPAPKPAGPAGPVARPKRVRRVAGPAGPVGRAKAPVGPAKPAAGPAGPVGRQITSPKVVRRRGQQKQAVLDAKQGRPFNPEHLRGAIQAGLAPDVSERNGTFLVKKRRAVLPDYQRVVRPSGENNTLPSKQERQVQFAAAPGAGPALKILEGTSVPSHAIAGLASGEGIKRGIKDKESFGKILKRAGVPGVVASTVGFAADVATDPTTYLTLGAGSVARKGAEKAALEQSAKGITVKFAGKQVPGITRGTAAIGRRVKTVAVKAPVPVKGAASTAREVVREVRPTISPAGADKAQFTAARQAARRHRAAVTTATNRYQREAHGLKKVVGAENYGRVIHAIETDTTHDLPAELGRHAQRLDRSYKEFKRQRVEAGLQEGMIEHYFPHAQETPLKKGLGIHTPETVDEAVSASGHPKIVRAPNSSKERKLRGTLADVNKKLEAEGKEQFSTDLPLVHVNYAQQTARASADAAFARDLAKAGRPYKVGEPDLHGGEALYRLGVEGKKFGLHPVDEAEKNAYLAGKGKDGEYVALDRRVVESATTAARPKQATKATARVVDRATGGFKRLATATPGFHVRNLIGDTQMHYLSVPAYKSPAAIKEASKGLKQIHREEDAQALFRDADPTRTTVKIAGKKMPVTDFVDEARREGVIRSGKIGRELQDLSSSQGVDEGAKHLKKGAGGRLHKVRRLYREDREDVLRLATYKHFRDTGLSPGDAADRALETHIDYGDLTETERTALRRLMPFYTFSARALPFHAKRLVTNPGKYANIEKAREEIGNATGVDVAKAQKNLPEYQARDVGIIANIKGKPVTISGGLPLNLLNELPVQEVKGVLQGHPAATAKYFDEVGQFMAGLVSPYAKAPVELFANKSFFFRKDIEDPNRPLVAAPDWVQYIPKKYWGSLGITKDYEDKQTGKKVWGWRGKADYLVKLLPGPANQANQLASTGTNRAGQDTGTKALSFVTGIKVRPVDAKQAKASDLYQEKSVLTNRRAALYQQGISADNPTPEFRRLSQRIAEIEAQLPKKKVRSSGSSSGWGSGSGSSSGGGWGG